MTFDELVSALKENKNVFKITNYVKPSNSQRLGDEISDVVIQLPEADYTQLVRQSLNKLSSVTEVSLRTLSKKYNADLDEAKKALNEAKTSLQKMLTGDSHKRAGDENYISIGRWVKIHKQTEDIYFTGYKMSETVHKSAEYKKVNSKAKTLIKRDLTQNLPNNLKVWKINKSDLKKVTLG